MADLKKEDLARLEQLRVQTINELAKNHVALGDNYKAERTEYRNILPDALSAGALTQASQQKAHKLLKHAIQFDGYDNKHEKTINNMTVDQFVEGAEKVQENAPQAQPNPAFVKAYTPGNSKTNEKTNSYYATPTLTRK